MDDNVTVNAWVPIDDESTMIFNIDLRRAAGGGKKKLMYKDGTEVQGLARPLDPARRRAASGERVGDLKLRGVGVDPGETTPERQ